MVYFPSRFEPNSGGTACEWQAYAHGERRNQYELVARTVSGCRCAAARMHAAATAAAAAACRRLPPPAAAPRPRSCRLRSFTRRRTRSTLWAAQPAQTTVARCPAGGPGSLHCCCPCHRCCCRASSMQTAAKVRRRPSPHWSAVRKWAARANQSITYWLSAPRRWLPSNSRLWTPLQRPPAAARPTTARWPCACLPCLAAPHPPEQRFACIPLISLVAACPRFWLLLQVCARRVHAARRRWRRQCKQQQQRAP